MTNPLSPSFDTLQDFLPLFIDSEGSIYLVGSDETELGLYPVYIPEELTEEALNDDKGGRERWSLWKISLTYASILF